MSALFSGECLCVTHVAATGFVFQGYCFNCWWQEYVLCIWKTHHSLLFLLMASIFLLPLFLPLTHPQTQIAQALVHSGQAWGNVLVYIAKVGKGILCSLPDLQSPLFSFTVPLLLAPFSPFPSPFLPRILSVYLFTLRHHSLLFPCSSYTNVFFFVSLLPFFLPHFIPSCYRTLYTFS